MSDAAAELLLATANAMESTSLEGVLIALLERHQELIDALLDWAEELAPPYVAITRRPATQPEAHCWACGKTLEQHLDSRPEGAPVPRVPCLGLKQWFSAKHKPAEPAPAEAQRLDREHLTKMFASAITTRTFDGGAEVLLLGEPLDRWFCERSKTPEQLAAWADERAKFIRALLAKAIREAPP